MNVFPRDFEVPNFIFIYITVWAALYLTIIGYNIIKHLLHKELHNVIGKLLMTYNFFLAISTVSFFMTFMLIYKFFVNHNTVCHSVKLMVIATNIGYEATATCILVHCTYHFQQSYKIMPVDAEKDENY